MLPKYFSKIISLLFIFVFTSFIINAQIKIGLNGGPNFASYTLSNKDTGITLKHKFGFSIAAVAEYSLKNLSIRLNAGYIQRGGKNKIPALGNNDNKIYFDYIQLAPYVTYKFINSRISAKIISGLSFGHLVNAKANIGAGDFSIKNILKLLNITSDFGLELEIPIQTRTSLFFNGIYSLGLRNLSIAPGTLKTNDFNINIGFLYNLL